MTLPNILTMIRLLCLPVMIFFLVQHSYDYALIAFCFAALSDFFDGFIARKFNLTSKLGAFLDPIADKLFVLSTFIYFLMEEMIPLWFLLIIIFRDVGQFVGFMRLRMKKITFDPSSHLTGKLSTGANFLVIFMMIVSYFYGGFASYHEILFYTASYFTLIRVVQYSMLCARLYSH